MEPWFLVWLLALLPFSKAQSVCPPGKFGSDCNQICSQNCAARLCDSQSGRCSICKAGHYGDDCTQICSSRCEKNTCDRQTGVCYNCKAWYYGDDCTQICSSRCEKNTCDRQTGVCYNCKAWYYGDDCGLSCSSKCGGNGSCDRQTGVCDNNCMAGWYGTFCDRKCSDYCRDVSCDRHNGSCVYGRYDGHWETVTFYEEPPEGESTGLITGVRVGTGLALALVVVFGTGLSVYWYRLRNKTNGTGQSKSPGYDDVAQQRQDDHNNHDLYTLVGNYNLPHGETPDPEMLNQREDVNYENEQEQHDSFRKGKCNAGYVNYISSQDLGGSRIGVDHV